MLKGDEGWVSLLIEVSKFDGEDIFDVGRATVHSIFISNPKFVSFLIDKDMTLLVRIRLIAPFCVSAVQSFWPMFRIPDDGSFLSAEETIHHTRFGRHSYIGGLITIKFWHMPTGKDFSLSLSFSLSPQTSQKKMAKTKPNDRKSSHRKETIDGTFPLGGREAKKLQ